MDDNTRQVLVAIASGLIGLASGVVIAKIGFDHAATMENERRTRDDGLRADEEERARRERWIDRRRDVYTELIAASARIYMVTESPGGYDRKDATRAYAALAEVGLMRPRLKEVAQELVLAAMAGPSESDRMDAAQTEFEIAARTDIETAET